MHIGIFTVTLGTLDECKGKESALKLRVIYEEDITAKLQVLKIL